MTAADIETNGPRGREHKICYAETQGREHNDSCVVVRDRHGDQQESRSYQANRAHETASCLESETHGEIVAEEASGEIAYRSQEKRQSREDAHLGFTEPRALHKVNREPAEIEPRSPGVTEVHGEKKPNLPPVDQDAPREGRVS